MNYLCYEFIITDQRELYSEILMAELAEFGFEMFEDTSEGLKAYVPEPGLNESAIAEIYLLKSNPGVITYTVKVIERQNWNKEWETHFNPVTVAGAVYIRAEFHEPKPGYQYEIIIQPEMSFGTGHHDTTAGVVELMLKTDFKNKTVCDMGCGTSILAILAEKCGATTIDAFDIDEHCIENSKTNLMRNNCKFITVQQGDAGSIRGKKYDVILANINRNILLADMNIYANALDKNGVLILSGFYDDDVEAIQSESLKYNLKTDHRIDRNKWCALRLTFKSNH